MPKNSIICQVEGVIDKIKEIVMKRRIRLLEFFRDYDKLTSGRIIKSNFKRALDLAGLGLTMHEINLLAKKLVLCRLFVSTLPKVRVRL